MNSVPVVSVHDGVVRACDPHSKSVTVFRVRVTGAGNPVGRIEQDTVYVGETAQLGRTDIIVRRDSRLLVILGSHGFKPSPSWHLVDPTADQVLATVSMPPNTSTVLQSFISDHRTFGGRP